MNAKNQLLVTTAWYVDDWHTIGYREKIIAQARKSNKHSFNLWHFFNTLE